MILGFYNRLLATVRGQNPKVKVLLGLGGWTDSTNGDKYSRLVNDEPSRKNFVEKTVKMLKIRGFDGLSVEWHFPVCWQSDCKSGNPSDKSGFTSLLKVKVLNSLIFPHTFLVILEKLLFRI